MTDSLREIFATITPLLELSPGDRIVDLGCGDGWACRTIAAAIPDGLIVGIDASNDLVRDARARSADFENILYIWGNAEQIPWQADFFTAGLCLDSLTSFANPPQSLRELYRVLTAGGSAWIAAPKQASAPDYPALLAAAGFEQIESMGPHLHSAGGANPPAFLLIRARKPEAAGDHASESSNGKTRTAL